MIWTFSAVTLLLVLYWSQWRYKNRRLLEMAEAFPGPPTLPLIGNAHSFISQDIITAIKNLVEEYGDVVKFWLGPDLNIIVTNPDDIKTLLTDPKTSVRGPQYKYMADILRGGILSGSGIKWKKHRKIANPNYSKRAIESYSEIFNKEVAILLQKFRELPPGKQFNLYDYIVQSTTYSVCQTLMGLSREETLKLPQRQYIVENTAKMYRVIFDRMTKWYLQIDPVFWVTESYASLKKSIPKMDEFCAGMLKNRVKALETMEKSKMVLLNNEEDTLSNTQLSVIDRFLLSKELEPLDLLRETFTVFTTSQEASAKIASYLLLMMAYHPNCQEKLYEEIISVIGDKDRPVTDKDLKRMPYLDMAFKEVLRLFPIGAMLQRTIHEDIAISSGTLPAGSSLVVPVYHMHRDSRFWDNPDAFDPERFDPENTKLRRPNGYIPFSLGPMDCLGRYFATNLIKTICVRTLREFKITSVDTYKDLRVKIAISVYPVNGYNAMLTPRNKKE